ncbi:MAG: HEAT repeat domain-containing protein [Planctomycetota bacterium]
MGRAAVNVLRLAVVALGPVWALALWGCESPRPVRPDLDLHSPSATRRLEAVGAAAKSGDRSYVPALFDRLVDDDEAVRMAAAAALRDLIGRDPGYKAFETEGDCAAKAAAWRAAWQAGGSPTPSSSGPGGARYTGGAAHGAPR